VEEPDPVFEGSVENCAEVVGVLDDPEPAEIVGIGRKRLIGRNRRWGRDELAPGKTEQTFTNLFGEALNDTEEIVVRLDLANDREPRLG